MTKTDILIVGGGPAGLTAAIYASRAGADVTVIERASIGGQITRTREIDNYPGVPNATGFYLAMAMQEQAEKSGAKIIYDEISYIDLTSKVISTAYSGTFTAGAVILCMGAEPAKLGLPMEDAFTGSGVSYCAVCDGAFYRNKITAVVGGGNTAAEDALYLANFCEKVYLIHRRDAFRADKVLVEKLKTNERITILYNHIPVGLLTGKKVEGLTVENKLTAESYDLAIDGLFVAVGNLPSSQSVKDQIDTDANGYIITDEQMKTNIRGVFAAGDIRKKHLRQIVTACADGAIGADEAVKYIKA